MLPVLVTKYPLPGVNVELYAPPPPFLSLPSTRETLEGDAPDRSPPGGLRLVVSFRERRRVGCASRRLSRYTFGETRELRDALRSEIRSGPSSTGVRRSSAAALVHECLNAVSFCSHADGGRGRGRRRSVRRRRRTQSRLSRGHQRRPGRRPGSVAERNGVRRLRGARTRADRAVRGRTYVALQVPEMLRLCQAVARSALVLPERHAALLQARLRPVSQSFRRSHSPPRNNTPSYLSSRCAIKRFR